MYVVEGIIELHKDLLQYARVPAWHVVFSNCLIYCVCCSEGSENTAAKQPSDVVMATGKEAKDDEVQTDSAGGILARFRGGWSFNELRTWASVCMYVHTCSTPQGCCSVKAWSSV